MPDSSSKFSMVCMDCNETYRAGAATSGISHGLCVKCFAVRVDAVPADEMSGWLDEQVDALPVGKIVLDRQLCVVGYSREEEELTGLDGTRLMGKRFFEEVAPCMAADEVGGWCAAHVSDLTLSEKIVDWYLPLHSGGRVAMLEICAGKGMVVMRIDVTEGGRSEV